ncbi:MAG TPA: efflux RND transporter periplasmic adaptor subunit [Draconibacterium sp.]|nr:efflux RND transporter periplasmic adaptor subunit [Draconibacterium sp.]
MSVKNKSIIGIVVAVVAVIIIVLLGSNGFSGEKTYTVKKDNFESVISVKGEIQGKNAILISLPDILKKRDLRIYEFQIKDLIQEGTKVKKGDWIATLDIASITQQIQNNNDDLERRRAEFNDAKIDSAIELTKLREELKEFTYDLEYKEVELEQAKYESPAYQRKVKVEYNKTVRQMDKKHRDYQLKQLDLKVKTRRIEDRYDYYLRRDSLLKQAVVAARITAPKDGMIMYAKLWGGRKLRIGDYISQWNSTIATLPDMSVLVSETYVEEIQITKIAEGDSVEITVDALPDKKYAGEVIKIANIGQELNGIESKVFRVLIEIKGSNPELKPAMTANNDIILKNVSDVLTIPRECLFSQNGNDFVYLKKSGKIYKKKVIAGTENEEKIMIKQGLNENDKILFTPPKNAEEIDFYKSLALN